MSGTTRGKRPANSLHRGRLLRVLILIDKQRQGGQLPKVAELLVEGALADKGYIDITPLISALIYMAYDSPITLILLGATFGAFMLPVQAFVTLHMQRTRMDPRVRPRRWVTASVWVVFGVMAALCGFYLYHRILPALLG